jgi:hypothetical protein
MQEPKLTLVNIQYGELGLDCQSLHCADLNSQTAWRLIPTRDAVREVHG